METTTLDDLMALNDQLAALAEAGVPLDMEGAAPGKDIARTLESINAAIARRVSRGASLEEALEGDEAVPAWYRCLVLLGLRSGNIGAALDASRRVAKSAADSRQTITSALFYPLVVCLLAYIGMIGFCLFFVPTLERTYDSLEIQPGLGLTVLQSARLALPYWIAVPPIALLLLLLGWRLGSSRRGAGGRAGRAVVWLSGMSRAIVQQRWASFAEALAGLLERGVPLEEALPLAGCACGDPSLAEGGQALTAAMENGQHPTDHDPAAKRFPPLLRWAILRAEPTIGQSRALDMAARVYRQAARHRAEQSRLVAPMVTCVIIGGGVTLLYGLALFVPVVELLRAAAY